MGGGVVFGEREGEVNVCVRAVEFRLCVCMCVCVWLVLVYFCLLLCAGVGNFFVS